MKSFVVLLLGLLAPFGLHAKRLIVGTKVAAPFAMKDEAGHWTGISIDLWRQIATDLHYEFDFRETDLKGLIAGIHDSTFDVGIAAISVTPERERLFDFTHPYYNSGLGIAVTPTGTADWFYVLRRFLSADLLKLFAVLAGSTMAIGFLMWLAERRANPEQFGGGWKSGVGSGFWWSAVTLTTVGYGDKTPRTVIGRLLALFWMVSAIVMVSSFTATMTTALTINQLESRVKGPEDLVRVRVGSIKGATSETYLTQHGIVCREYAAPADGLRDLSKGKIDAMVYDAPILRYWANREYHDRITILPSVFEKQYYAIGLPAGSPLRKEINQAVLERTRGNDWQEIIRRYLGE